MPNSSFREQQDYKETKTQAFWPVVRTVDEITQAPELHELPADMRDL
jgi:hypothetical protein